MKPLDIKFKLALFLILFAAYLSFMEKDRALLFNCLIAATSAILSDSIITYIKSRKFILSDSSIVSGLIIGFVLSSGQPWWIFPLASVLAISSKRFIHINKRHIFNPAGFGILTSVLLFNASTRWKGANLWYILIPSGFYFVCKIRKLEIVYGYLAVSLVLFGGQAIFQKSSLPAALMYQNWFFIFVMLIEPKTTPAAKIGKILFGGLAAAIVFLLSAIGATIDAELTSLLTLNFFVPVLNKK